MEREPIDYGEPSKPYWRCECCGYENHNRAMPKDRQKFYNSGRARICPKCKSEGLVPVGF